MAGNLKARIIGLGSYLPERILTNKDLEKLVETSDEWIVSRTGMRERRIAAKDECTSDMGLAAAKKALEQAGIDGQSLDMIICATMTPDYVTPSSAALIQAALKATKAGAADLQAACTGYIYAISLAKAYVESGMYKNVLIVAAEKMSAYIDYTDRNTCVLFGDGAAAAVVSATGAGYAIDHTSLGSDGSLYDLAIMPGGGVRNPASHESVDQRLHFFKMNGKELFKNAVRRMGTAATECIQNAGLRDDQISWLVPHQANERIIDAMAKHVNFDKDKVYRTLHKYGNTSGSSVGIALDELTRQEKIIPGEHLLLVAFGAGLTWGATILTKITE